jgi:ethanolamine utilization protein EutJ
VVEKISSIIIHHINGFEIKEISLVGGTCCLDGIEEIIEKKTGIFTHKPKNPMFVTPLGIALSCRYQGKE